MNLSIDISFADTCAASFLTRCGGCGRCIYLAAARPRCLRCAPRRRQTLSASHQVDEPRQTELKQDGRKRGSWRNSPHFS